ncbi:RHS repeat-associated core domain-containing protein [Runella zeae]|uniref:RHS repeat-associated core domain-containing protein n=1 Tax=Runella zeae TaxID=94255 RepID=UPI002353A5F6|nr:RHS repeat-associated core domain-containing protein [Runella zeae]
MFFMKGHYESLYSIHLLFLHPVSCYDDRGRVIQKLIPGAGWTFMVYNKLDQVTLTQNERQRAQNKWTFNKYDAFGRTVLTGELTNSSSRSTLQSSFDGHSTQYENRSGAQFGYTNLSFPFTTADADVNVVQYYDDYAWSPPASFASTGALGVQHTDVKGMATGTKTRILGASDWLETVHYYDIRGRVIQTHEKNQFGLLNRTDTEYNFAGDVLKTKTTHNAPGSIATTLTTRYEYDGMGRKIKTYHQINNETERELARFEYDPVGRMVRKDWQKLESGGYGSVATTPEYITRNTSLSTTVYDKAQIEITLETGFGLGPGGEYTGEIFGEGSGPTFADLQKIDYHYHLRGWLTGVNLDSQGNPAVDEDENDLFSMSLSYETDGQYNGNIGKQRWRSYQAKDLTRQYAYAYDPADRLTGAAYSGGNSGENYSLSNLSYTKNGNITALTRQGMTAGTPTAPTSFGNVDVLTYSYEGNRLKAVEDGVTASLPAEIHDFKNTATQTTEYTYYNDGSLQSDLNKGITSISYNYLGLPEQIWIGSSGDYIKNTYDGSGRKLRKEVHQSSGSSYTHYEGAIVYSGAAATPQLDFITHDEGRALNPTLLGGSSGDGFAYEYHYRDHLGNLRVAVRQQAATTTSSATMEVSEAAHEERAFSRISDTRTGGIAYEGNYSAELRGETGPSKTFGVIAGEKITARVYGYVEEKRPEKKRRLIPLPIVGTERLQTERHSTRDWVLKGGVLVPVTTHKNAKGEERLPKAYLQLVVLDSANRPLHIEKRYLDSAAVGGWQELKIDYLAKQNATLQVSLVNSTEHTSAFFDNLSITNDPPAIVQENHYDPWGWNLVGIEVQGDAEHKWQYLDREKIEDLGLEWYDLKARGYESVLGRFHSVDPLPDAQGQESLSTYQYGWNNPVRLSDPNGNCQGCPEENGQIGMMIGAAVMSVKNSIMTLAYNAGDALGITPTAKGMKWEAVERRVGDKYETVMEQVPRQGFWQDAGGHLLDGINAVAAVSPASGTTTGLLAKTVPNAVVTSSAKGGIYALKDGQTVVRTGRTKDLARREIEHAKDPVLSKYKFEEKYRTDNYAEQRGLEHKVSKQYESTASKANGGHNKIEAIRDKNPNKPIYLQAADNYLKRQ